MTSTPIAVRNGLSRVPLDVLVSPQSSHHKRIQKRLSTGVTAPHQSPNLPEVEENDSKSARQRRHSRNFTGILHSARTPSKSSTSEDASEARAGFRWSKDQLLQHYSQCMKLSQENKINHKNAFDLQLIEHMGEMIRQDGALNFRVAGGTIFAGAKIYASRVDAIHSEIYRVLSSLGSGDKDDNQVDDDQDNEDPEKKTRKRKKISKILETNEAALRLPLINSYGSTETAGRLRGKAIDAASCDSVMANQVELCDNEAILQHDSNLQLKDVFGGKNEDVSDFHSAVSAYKTGKKSSSNSLICDAFNDLNFDTNTLDLDFADTVSSEEETTNSQAEFGNPEETLDDTIPENDDPPDCDPPLCDDDGDSVFPARSGSSSYPNPQDKPFDVSHVADIAQLVAAAPHGEYSYFKPSVLSVCDGPAHWLRHKSARTAPPVSTTQGDMQPLEGSLPKKRKTVKRGKKFKCEKIVEDKRVQPQKMSKSKTESLRMSVQDQLFLESNDFSSEMIQRAMEVKVVLRQLNSALIKQAGVTVNGEADVTNFNYNNDDYCPARVDSDYDDDAHNDHSRDMFQSSAGFFPDLTQNVTAMPPNTGEDEYNDLLEGDHLVSQPRKVEKIQVHFAKHAKRIDVRKLKNAMWSIIKVDEPEDDQLAKKATLEGDSPQKDSPDCKNKETTKDQTGNSDTSTEKEAKLFSEMYQVLPNSVSKNMWNNMSVPLAFTCLLHLANEKQLKIEGTPALSDLKISHGL